ncbi:MAG: hypothetical protein HXY35_16530 [Chloroflexi bacterium]|nr:hypothetical protein [Chloroflexota bacterium]
MFVRKLKRQMFALFTIAALMLSGCNVGATPAPTLDVNAINTALVGTTVAQLSAQLTQTALAVPTNTPAPTDTAVSLPTFALPTAGGLPTTSGALPTVSFNTTPIPGFTQLASPIAPTQSGGSNTAVGCNDGLFIGETLPDGSKVGAGKKFEKAWEIKNTGTCAWDEGYVFAFIPERSSSEIEGYDIVINDKDEFVQPNESQSFVVKLTAPTEPGEYKAYWQLMSDENVFFGPLVYLDIIVK